MSIATFDWIVFSAVEGLNVRIPVETVFGSLGFSYQLALTLFVVTLPCAPDCSTMPFWAMTAVWPVPTMVFLSIVKTEPAERATMPFFW